MVAKLMLVYWGIVLVILLNAAAFVWDDRISYIEMTPRDPKVHQFNTLVLNCTMTQHYEGPCNASEIYVQSSDTEFKYPYIRAVTSRTAEFRLSNVTFEQRGRYTCRLPTECLSVQDGHLNAQSVHVVGDPMKPFLIDCTVDNWESMVCSWGPNSSFQGGFMGSSSPKYLRQQFLWQNRGGGDNWTLCPEAVSERCFWRSANFTMTEEFCVKIIVWNELSPNISSDVECRNPELIVKPKPPTNIRKMTSETEDNRMLSIEWSSPTAKQVTVIYHLIVHSEWEVRNLTVVNDTSIDISAVPFTNYDISMVAFPSERGFSSNQTLARLSTAPAAPIENPFVMSNFYSINTDEKVLMLYWQPISKKDFCGPEFCYYLVNRTSSISPNSSKCINSTYSTELRWGGFASDLLIVSRNKVGSAPNPSLAVHVLSDDNFFIDLEVITEGQGRDVYVDWFIDKPSADRGVESVMLFWCQPQSTNVGICKTPIQWHTNNALQRGFSLTVDEEFQTYQFGVSVKFSGRDFSGIKWAKKRYSLTNVPEAPKELQVSVTSGKHSELQILWMEPPHNKHSACIRSFVIFYCTVDDQNECLYDNQSVTVYKYLDHLVVSGGNDFHFILKGLNPYTMYKIWMTSVSRQGSSQRSEFAFGKTTQPWLTMGKIVGMAIGGLLAASFVIVGSFVTFRCCDKYRKKLTSGFQVSLPPQRFQLPSTSSEVPMLREQTALEYWRQQSQVSVGSRDSGHFSFPPSSPAMLPLLSVVNDELKERVEPERTKNCYQQANTDVAEKIEDGDDGSVSSALGVTTYKIVPNGDANVTTQVNQIQYILPEQINQVGNGTLPANVANRLAGEGKFGGVNYCNDLNFTNAGESSDIGYTKIEQLPTASYPSVQLASDRSSADSNLLFCLDPRPGEFGSTNWNSVPAVSHLDELLVALRAGQPPTDAAVRANAEPVPVSDSYPLSVIKVVDDNLPLHSKQALSRMELNISDIQGTEDYSCDNGYLPHNRLFGID